MAYEVSLAKFSSIIKKFPEEAEAALISGMRSTALRGASVAVEQIDAAKPHPAVDRGQLRGSIGTRILPDGGSIHADSPHAIFMELGTRPFRPPIAPIAEWVMRKFGKSEDEANNIAFLIARKMSLTGIAPRFYMKKAFDSIRRTIMPQEIQAALKSLKNRR